MSEQTETFDWAGLYVEASRRYVQGVTIDAGENNAAAYLRTRIEAAFVPRADFDLVMKVRDDYSVMITARAEAAEAENARLRAVIQHRGGPLCPARYSTAAECNCGVTAALGDEHE